eukprot:symbB.v1.2.036093.t1/scaffold5018.1/size31776/5
MGRRSKSREVSKERLGPDFSEDEANFYRKYFRKLGGKKRDFLERSQVEQFLQRSELSQEILDEILKISIEFGETVDFEAFCVACRLVAHAQELGLVQVEQVALVPSNVPWFSEPAEKEVEASFQTVQEVQVEEPEFDFEGVALGVNAEAFSGRPTEAPDTFTDQGQGIGEQLKALELKGRAAIEPPRPSGSAKLLESSLATGAGDGGQADPRPADQSRIRRVELDSLALLQTVEEPISKLRERLDSGREKHQKLRLQLADSAADARRLFANLDFARQQIEDFERLVARLREARSLYSKAELDMAKAKSRGMADAGLEVHREHDRARVSDLSEKVRRAGRRKQDLQGKQQVLLAHQRQAEQDRNYARKALDSACKRLLELQAQRLQVCQERHQAAQEALKLAKECMQKADDLKRPQRMVHVDAPSWQRSPGEAPAENGWASFGGHDPAHTLVNEHLVRAQKDLCMY